MITILTRLHHRVCACMMCVCANSGRHAFGLVSRRGGESHGPVLAGPRSPDWFQICWGTNPFAAAIFPLLWPDRLSRHRSSLSCSIRKCRKSLQWCPHTWEANKASSRLSREKRLGWLQWPRLPECLHRHSHRHFGHGHRHFQTNLKDTSLPWTKRVSSNLTRTMRKHSEQKHPVWP